MCDAIRSTDLNNVEAIDMLSLDVLVLKYDETLKTVMNTLAPVKTATVTIRPEAKWYTDEIRQGKQGRRQAERRWGKSQLEVHRLR